jgi:CO dehydrogenase nickel-insertion accessory protein CooC1
MGLKKNYHKRRVRMVSILAGRAGSGKSRICTERLKTLTESGCEKLIVVVP